MPEDESIVLKPHELLSDAILSQNADELAAFMDQPQVAIAEAITGAIAAGPKAWVAMTGRIVQGTLKGKLFQQVGQELEDLRAKGKIREDFADEKYKYGFKSWVELLTIIDEETPDADRLEALKAMFYAVNKVNATDGERILSYQLFQIAKKLTSGEILLLKAIFETYKSRDFDPNRGNTIPLIHWAQKIASRLGYGLTALVLRDGRALVEQGLISRRLNSPDLADDQQAVLNSSARLTDLGIKFCDSIQSYQVETK
jgi:hypothetical protein